MRLLAFVLSFSLAACASRELASPVSPVATGVNMGHSAIQIDYVRGDNHHRLVAKAEPASALLEFFSDTRLLRKGKIGLEKFDELARQAQALLDSQTPPQSTVTCRTPFVLKVTRAENTKSVEGCRSGDQGVAVGTLIRQAEFLVHSQP